jgi:RHS repeat-associated protein
MVNPRERIAYRYERNPDDPNVQQEFMIQVDPLCGQPVKSCKVFLPRRASAKHIYPEQLYVRANASYNQYINTSETEDYRYRGIPCQIQEFEIFGLDLKGKQYCSFDDALEVSPALDNPLPYQVVPTSGKLQAQQLTWGKNFFWNEGQDVNKDDKGALPLGKISSHGLAHHNETAVFTKEFASEVFGLPLTDDTIQLLGGYFFDTENGYWWNKGLVQYYFDPSQPASFYLPCKTENTFAASSTSLFSKSVVEYDQPYNLSIIKTTQFIDEATKVGNSVTAKIDYLTMEPYQKVDMNGNVSQVLFDPLGKVIVTTQFGTENGEPVGGMRLYPYNGQPAQYVNLNDASFDDVLNASHKYLQGATGYFYYNLQAWKDQQQPPCAIKLVRDDFYLTASAITEFSCKTEINYSDGFERTLESKVKTGDRWTVSGRTLYNNKGKACEKYLPYFSDTPFFETQDEITDQNLVPPPTVTQYDPLLRVIRTDSPKGFFSKVEFTPWEEKKFDEDDTVLDSTYFINFMKNYPKPPAKPTQAQLDELDALNKAAKFFNTPSISILDSIGNTIRLIKNNLGSVSPDRFAEIVKGTSVTSADLFNELVTKEYLIIYSIVPSSAWVSDKFQPYTTGFVLALDDPYKQFSEKVIILLKQNCLTAFSASDIQKRPTLSIDPRLYYSNQSTGTNYYNFKYRYAMGEKDPVYADSVDAGLEKKLNNIFGNQFWSLSPRNYCQLISYDRLQRRSAVQLNKLTDHLPITSYANFNVVEVFEYGDSPAAPLNNNLRGQLWRVHDLSGLLMNSQYSLHGELMETSRQMTSNCKTSIAWNCLPPPAQEKWDTLPSPSMEMEIYTSQFTYNALKLLKTETSPDGTITTNTYKQNGLLDQVNVIFKDATKQQVIKHIEYDAKGLRTSIQYGNGITTNYFYEPSTLHLVGILSTRLGTPIQTVQDITYTYDPVGNITRSWNNTFKTVFNNNQQVDPLSDYSYDALYRLIKANGRQHSGINANTYKNNAKDGDFKQCLFSQLPNTNDSDKLENYSEVYCYDDADNLINKQHIAKAGSSRWSQKTDVEANSNRLAGWVYDESGNLHQLDINTPSDPDAKLLFNCYENLVSARIIIRPDELDDCDYYLYDSNKQRTRKVGERMAHAGAVSLIEDKIYLSNYEVKRNISVNSQGDNTVTMERQTLRIMDGTTCVLTVNYCVIGKEAGTRKLRFQMGNNLGSISSEYDQNAQLISYEEYFPFGGTAIIAGSNQTEVRLKDYRYSGKECDDSTGLYYYGRRYYVSWLGRWLNSDPAGTVDGLNLFAFVSNNPLKYKDALGMARTQAGLGSQIGAAIGGLLGAIGGGIGGFFLGGPFGAIAGAILGGIAGAAVGGGIGYAIGNRYMVNPLIDEGPLSTITDIHFGINNPNYDATPVTLPGAPAGFAAASAGLGKRTEILRTYGGTVAEFPWDEDVRNQGPAPVGYSNNALTVSNQNVNQLVLAPGNAKYLGDKSQVNPALPGAGLTTGIRYSKGSLVYAAQHGHVHFHLDGMGTNQDVLNILNKNPANPHIDAVTSSELRYVRRFWQGGGRQVALPGGGNLEFSRANVTLYRNAQPLSLHELGQLGFN